MLGARPVWSSIALLLRLLSQIAAFTDRVICCSAHLQNSSHGCFQCFAYLYSEYRFSTE